MKISTDQKLLQFDRVHKFLSEQAYWCLGIPRETVEKAARGSLCFGLYTDAGVQIGYARIVTDGATFAWLCDLYVEKQYQGKGFGKQLMEYIMGEPSLKGLRRICLATKDAHSLYKKYGFKVTETPENWMEIKNNNIYRART